MKADILPSLGSHSIASVGSADVVAMVKAIDARGAHETARRALEVTGQIFRYGVANGTAPRNPAADIRPGDILTPFKSENFAKVSAELSRTRQGGSKAMDDLEWALIDATPDAILQPAEIRVLKRRGLETRFNIEGKPCTMEEFKAYAKRKCIDPAKLEKRITICAGEREQITTRSEVTAE